LGWMRGIIMIAMGAYFAFVSIYSWGMIISHWELEATAFTIAVIFTLISIVLLSFGIRTYKKTKNQQYLVQ